MRLQVWLNKLFRTLPMQVLTIAGLAGLTLAVMFPGEVLLFKKLSNYAFYLVFLEIAMIFFFLIIQQNRLMFASIFASGLLCFFLKHASNQNLILPAKNDQRKITAGLFHMSALQSYLQEDMAAITHLDGDLLIFTEITPEWKPYLKEQLDSCYPFQAWLTRSDPFGQVIFSRFPILSVDTIYYMDSIYQLSIPSLRTVLDWEEDKPIQCISTYALPPLDDAGYRRLGGQLTDLAAHIPNEPYFTLFSGLLNVPNWTTEVTSFRQQMRLLDSRRFSKFFKLPFDHLFYSDRFECTSFQELQDPVNYFGIVGTYQIRLP
ncbi:MAG TPA: hypothetical protein P5275_13950 [Saprospiraceae bacterium]|nr:hypothetical protein [Saprospiraceae bacterium]MCB9272283.1 hypothetical protein [Lewinellaceae bacterium]HPG08108.1 hypothetical protein [Saprospiraceae bacterium]HPQ99188.1 hypothetical protein [Saprospiraceae bacterium]HRV85970.1 hypothetical protein [Saprospiraceae bacterium]